MPKLIDSKTPKTYDAFRNPESQFHFEKYSRMLDFVKLGKNKVLEIGSGTGVYTAFLLKDFKDITATDLDKEMLSILKKKFPKIKARVADCALLPFRNESFGIVFGVSILHHLEKTRRLQVFHEARRVLKKGGFFVLFEPNKLNPMTCLFQLVQREDSISRFELSALMHSAGFKRIALKEILFSVPFFKGALGKKPILSLVEKIVEKAGLGVTVMMIAKK